MLLDGKVALITGAASGIGRATALRFAREGARVGLLDFNPDTLGEAAAEVDAEARKFLPLSLREREAGDEGALAIPLLADVRDPAAMNAAVERLVERFGRLDILFANAGIAGLWAPVGDIRPDEFDRLFSINVRGTFLSVQAALPALRAQGGSIVITASVTGNAMFSSVGASVYASTKAAQLAFGKMLAFELAHERIRVNIVCPGNVSTNILDHISYRNMEKLRYPVRHSGDVPLTDGAPASPDQIAAAVLFLVSDEAGYVTGEALVVDGAQSMFRG
ncbi:MAG: SDR family NAD(P)-dependent oxidoreductase [Anaerolineaceae bacterium]|nr:SDR family NAD(P)-dependent oxidoreductase [Anaerolineaceae bacterium]MCY3908125.1 SDR family NAD(P)-dependent oxidoreductase [Anaerolineaceae bacterium]